MIHEVQPETLPPQSKPLPPDVVRSLGVVLFEQTHHHLRLMGDDISHLEGNPEDQEVSKGIPVVSQNYQRLQEGLSKMIHAEEAYLVPDAQVTNWELGVRTGAGTNSSTGVLEGDEFSLLENALFHEVATPLTAVQIQAQLLSRATSSDGVKATVAHMNDHISGALEATSELWEKWGRNQSMRVEATATHVEIVFRRADPVTTTP